MRCQWPAALAFSTTFLAAGAVQAQSIYCSKPEPPYCIDGYNTFENEYSFRDCKFDMERYLDDIERYTQCLFDEADTMASEARREANETIERFNCKAEGNSFCP